MSFNKSDKSDNRLNLLYQNINNADQELQSISSLSQQRDLPIADNFKLKASISSSPLEFDAERMHNEVQLQDNFFYEEKHEILEYLLKNQEEFWKADVQNPFEPDFLQTNREYLASPLKSSSGFYSNEISYNHQDTQNVRHNDSIDKKLGRRPTFTGLTQRKYVVLKTLLRRIKTFFWNDFKDLTKYFKLKKYKRIAHFERWIQFYIANCLQEDTSIESSFVFGSFISSRDMKSLVLDKSKSLVLDRAETADKLMRIDAIYSTLHKFNESKFADLAKNSIISSLIVKFYNRMQDELSPNEAIGIQMLLDKCIKTADIQ